MKHTFLGYIFTVGLLVAGARGLETDSTSQGQRLVLEAEAVAPGGAPTLPPPHSQLHRDTSQEPLEALPARTGCQESAELRQEGGHTLTLPVKLFGYELTLGTGDSRKSVRDHRKALGVAGADVARCGSRGSAQRGSQGPPVLVSTRIEEEVTTYGWAKQGGGEQSTGGSDTITKGILESVRSLEAYVKPMTDRALELIWDQGADAVDVERNESTFLIGWPNSLFRIEAGLISTKQRVHNAGGEHGWAKQLGALDHPDRLEYSLAEAYDTVEVSQREVYLVMSGLAVVAIVGMVVLLWLAVAV